MSNYIPFDLYQQIKLAEPKNTELITPNKRFREIDLEMNENPISENFDKENTNPETNHPVVKVDDKDDPERVIDGRCPNRGIFEGVIFNENTTDTYTEPPTFTFSKPEKPLFINNTEFNPFIKRALPTKPAVFNRKFNTGFSGQHHVPILDENGIKKRDLRFSKIVGGANLNGGTVYVNNYTQLRNKMLGMFYRKVLRQESDVSYCRDGLSVHGVGSKQSLLAIVSLAKILHFRLNLKLRLRDGQVVCLAVA